MTDPLTGSAAHGLAMQPPSVVLESITVAIQQPPRWILKVVRGPSKFEWREAKIGISASPRGLSVTETRYEHGFTSPSPWCKPTDATRRRWSAPFSRPPPVAGGPARRGRSSVGGGRRWRCARRAGGGAPGWPCASIHCDSMAQRRDGGVLAVRLERRTGMCGGAVEPLVWRKAAALQPGGEDTPPSLEKSEQ